MLYRHCYIPSFQAQAVPNNFIQLYAKNVHRNIMKRTTNSHRIDGNRKRRRTWTKNIKNSKQQSLPLVARLATIGNRKHWLYRFRTHAHRLFIKRFRLPHIRYGNIFFQQEHENCKLALVSDCFGYVFSRPIFNKHFTKVAIENDYTIDERKSNIVRNRVFDCRLSPDCELFLAALVSDCFGYVFSRHIL